ncbi:hypothetical protein GOBAR_DD10361 [Gossypium barbadense]|nr:hypothetical protein GOBAR_DD10361 [Gossypium barbadense]
MATIIMDSAKVVVLDIRFPTLPVVELRRHQASVNAVAWAPHSSCHICTAGDDSQALIWDLSSMGQPVEGGLDPILAYTAGAEIEQLQWSSSQPDWVAIAFSTKLQILRLPNCNPTYGVGVFASVSADGSVRVFDLRDKEHSTIIYESSEPDAPLVRLGWNKQDPRYMATIIMDSAKVVVLDIRFPTLPVVELRRHQASANAVAWAPHSSCHICTAGDDSQALIWDLSSMGQPVKGGLDPILAYTAGAEIEQLQWSSSQPDWVAIAFSTKLQILRV